MCDSKPGLCFVPSGLWSGGDQGPPDSHPPTASAMFGDFLPVKAPLTEAEMTPWSPVVILSALTSDRGPVWANRDATSRLYSLWVVPNIFHAPQPPGLCSDWCFQPFLLHSRVLSSPRADKQLSLCKQDTVVPWFKCCGRPSDQSSAPATSAVLVSKGLPQRF